MTDLTYKIMRNMVCVYLEDTLDTASKLMSPSELDQFEGALQTAEGCLLVTLKSIKGDTNDQ